MRKTRRSLLWFFWLLPLLSACASSHFLHSRRLDTSEETIILPPPDSEGGIPLTQALAKRRSLREYGLRALSMQELSQLLWATQGITDWRGFRTAPSAGATYPLEVYLATGDGLFHYEPQGHQLRRLGQQDLRSALAGAALQQGWVREAPAVFIFTAVAERTSRRYGQRAERYINMEIGHAAQNLLLQAVALGLGGVPVGAFEDDKVAKVLALPKDEAPLYIVPVGKQR
ncbi:MAG: SagB/ThcOx family dehydrogenase [Anaerolineae bacterium]